MANEKVIAEFTETNKQLQKRVETSVSVTVTSVTSPPSPTDTSNTLEADDSKVRQTLVSFLVIQRLFEDPIPRESFLV